MSDEQPEGYVEFSKIVEVGIREDGEEVKITAQGDDGGTFDMLIKADALQELIANLQYIQRSSQIKRLIPRPIQLRTPKLVEQPVLFLVSDLAGVVYTETGHIDLEIKAVGVAETLQLSIQKEHAQALFGLLLRLQPLDETPPS